MLVVALVALSGCGGDGGTGLTSTQAAAKHVVPRADAAAAVHKHKALPAQAWEGMPCEGSTEITYGGCGSLP